MRDKAHHASADAAAAPVVWLQPAAPAKPPEGAACNGCGLCCLAEPCPLGMLVSRRMRGSCVALRWSETDQRYWCGMVSQPQQVLAPRWRWLAPWAARLARRWISAGIGCDARLQTYSADPPAS